MISSQNKVFAYLGLTAILTLSTHFFLPKEELGNWFFFLVMWTPGLAAIVVSLLTKRSLKEIGWKLTPKWLALGWVLPIVYGFLAYGAIWIFGWGDVPNPLFIERSKMTLGMDSDNETLVIVSAFFYITLVNLIPSLIMGLGEEIGWRGFLVPELSKWLGFKPAAWISGIIWGAWHMPGILDGNYGEGTTPLWYRVACFSILVMAGAILFAWLRMKSESIWPVAIFHATHNGVIQAFFNRITLDNGNTEYFWGEFGIALAISCSLVAWFFYGKSPEPNPKSQSKKELKPVGVFTN